MADKEQKAAATVKALLTLADGGLSTGKALAHGALGVCPLYLARDSAVEYVTYEEALDAGAVKVSEMSDAGRVPELMLENSGTKAVLVIDGEQLIGAKQNRILNTTVLIAGSSQVIIPVSCVEQGRWHFEASREMRSAPVNLYAGSRATKARRVSENLLSAGRYDGGQREVWDETRARIDRDQVDSPTSALQDHFAKQVERIETFQRALSLDNFEKLEGRGMVGALFTLEGRVLGMDAFDKPATLEKQWMKLVNSYAVEAVDAKGKGTAREEACADFIERVARANMTTYKPPGMGCDVRLTADDIAGSALVECEDVVHIYAFQVTGNRGADRPDTHDNVIAPYRHRARQAGRGGGRLHGE